jgi:hypothetical protein
MAVFLAAENIDKNKIYPCRKMGVFLAEEK